jgi:hypothetical protein
METAELRAFHPRSPSTGDIAMHESAHGTWQTVRGNAAFRQNLEVELTKTEHRSTDRL